jgi:hypothetical protein
VAWVLPPFVSSKVVYGPCSLTESGPWIKDAGLVGVAMQGVAAVALPSVDHGFELAFIDAAGEPGRSALRSCWNLPFEAYRPVRRFPVVKGQRHWPGLWWSATNGGHVGYESWVERDVAMLLDFEAAVTGYASQPFTLWWSDADRPRRHVPDFFARLADGRGVVVDVRPAMLVDEDAMQVFEVTKAAASAVGWQFRLIGELPPVQAANLRWLAGYRHGRCYQPEVAAALLDAFASPGPLLAGAELAGDRLAVLPVLYHLLWRQMLTADLHAAPLNADTVVVTADGWAR